MAAACGPAGFGDLIALHAVHLAAVGEEKDIIVGGGDEHILHKVLILAGHAGNAPAAAALGAVYLHRLALDVAAVGKGDDRLLLGDEVFNIHFTAYRFDSGAAVIAELIPDGGQLGADDIIDHGRRAENFLQVFHLFQDSGQLILYLDALHAGKLSQTHGHNGGSLQIGHAEAFHQVQLGIVLVLTVADDVDDLIGLIHHQLQTLQNVLTLFGFFQVVGGTAGDDLKLELEILLQHLLQGHYLGHAVFQRQHNDADGILQLSKAVQLVQHHLRVGTHLQVNDDAHALAVAFIIDVADAVDTLILYQLGNALDQTGLIHHVGDLPHDDALPAVLHFLYLGLAAQGDLAAAGGIGRPDAAAAHDNAAGGEIRPLNVLHQLIQLGFGVVDEVAHRVADLPQVVGRNIGGHTHRDTHRAIAQQVGEAAGQYHRFLTLVIKVGVPVYGVLIDIREHVKGNLAQPCLGITVGGGGVTIDGTKVAVAIDERIAQREGLRQAHHGIVNTGIAVRMIPAQHITDDGRALAVGLIGGQAVLIGGKQNAAVNRLQSVPYIGQGTVHNDRHGVFQKALAHFVVQLHLDDPALIVQAVFSGYLIHYFINGIKIAHIVGSFILAHFFGSFLRHQTSRLVTYWAFCSINSLLGCTLSPIRMVKVSSARMASSMFTRSMTRRAGSMVVSHSCTGSISPKPLYRWISTLPVPSGFSSAMQASRSASV